MRRCWSEVLLYQFALPVERSLRRRSCGGDDGRIGGPADAAQNPADGVEIEDGGEQPSRSLAVGTSERVDEEDAAQQFGPNTAGLAAP